MKYKDFKKTLNHRIEEMEAEFDYEKNGWEEGIYFAGYTAGMRAVLDLISQTVEDKA